MLQEVVFFENIVGGVIMYKERMGYSVERRICRMPGIYRCRLYHYANLADAQKRFDKSKSMLVAIQTRRQKNK